ncbi:hypothetical protein EW146_g2058 [Bondarzewia mesenterica]|uniref:U3 small nucleolar RNA-associated protein 11 n=1 Tax=Bondarzewia mesenterica TaxID=1095465 RepID=A0A4S4M2E7_9AGAM|nr:hypothetical protein EW146_g2058 [Bondarzewia mesenterica]
MSSSIRNSLHRRNHKERSQLAHRTRLGILEKHKDYVLRARDYHSKQDRITRLKQKAADRNKDEFYFSMNRQRTEGGVHIQDRGSVALPADIVKVLKSQDENYIRTVRAAGLKKIEKLKSQLSALADLFRPGQSLNGEDDGEEELDEEELEILMEAGVIAGSSSKRQRKSRSKQPAKHIIFAENEEEARLHSKTSKSKDDKSAMDVEEVTHVDLGWKTTDQDKHRKKHSKLNEGTGVERESAEDERREAATQHRGRLLKELSARLSRDRMVRYAVRELEMQKLLMGKGASKKLQGVEKVDDVDDKSEDDVDDIERKSQGKGVVDEKMYKPRVYRWRAERKR